MLKLKPITVSKTKYAHLLTMLDEKTSGYVMDLNPPDAEPYEALKARLIETFAVSDIEKAARLLDMTGMDDKTPSQCLGAMPREI